MLIETMLLCDSKQKTSFFFMIWCLLKSSCWLVSANYGDLFSIFSQYVLLLEVPPWLTGLVFENREFIKLIPYSWKILRLQKLCISTPHLNFLAERWLANSLWCAVTHQFSSLKLLTEFIVENLLDYSWQYPTMP